GTGDGDGLEGSATRVPRVREARRVEGIDPTKEIRDLQADEEEKERGDGEEGRRAGGGAQETAKARQDGGRRSLGRAPCDKEQPSRDPGEDRREQDATDELADRPLAKIKDVGDRAREDRVRAREEQREDDEKRKSERDPDAHRNDPPSGPARERPTQVG